MVFENAEGTTQSAERGREQSVERNNGLDLPTLTQGSDFRQVLKDMNGSSSVDLPGLRVEETGTKGGCTSDSKCFSLPDKLPGKDGGTKPWFDKKQGDELKDGGKKPWFGTNEGDENKKEKLGKDEDTEHEAEDEEGNDYERERDDECAKGKNELHDLVKKGESKGIGQMDKTDKSLGKHMDKLPPEKYPDKEFSPEKGPAKDGKADYLKKLPEIEPSEKKNQWLKQLQQKISKS